MNNKLQLTPTEAPSTQIIESYIVLSTVDHIVASGYSLRTGRMPTRL